MRKIQILLVLCAISAAFAATAQSKKPKRADIKDAIFKLKSPNPEEVMYSVQLLAASGSKDAVGPLTDLLRSGPRNDITNGIIQALGSIGEPGSVPILIEYMGHRRSDARVAAIYALENYKDGRVTASFEQALRDSDSQVRATAALALGKRGSRSSVPVLFQAFDRGVYDAAISIGQLGAPGDASRLAQYLGKADVKVLLPGFDEFVRREDFPNEAKLQILAQLFELAGPDVKRFAMAYKASFPPGADEDKNELYKMVNRMVRQIQEE
jgi:HEAT repeat protein